MERKREQCGLLAILIVLSFILPLSTTAGAQDAPAPTDSQLSQNSQPSQDSQPSADQDPPGRVARLSLIDGAVSFQPAGASDWTDASLNRPLMSGDNLWADENSRAEVQVGSTSLHLSAQTGITLLELSDEAAQIRLVQGSLIVRVHHVDASDLYEIDMPNTAFVPTQPGDYRLDVSPDGSRSDVTVWHGHGEVTVGGSSYEIATNQHATFIGTDQPVFEVAPVPGSDGFGAWAERRDQMDDDSESASYVSTEMTGYEDLDQYGSWTNVAGYGPVWAPTFVEAGWAPYRFGRWTWIGPWGWTWVADEPWGFAPYHYGRWAFVGTNWVWVPGPAMVRPVYAPALVAWLGGGPQARFSFGNGVGWVPLAPGEVFLPSYRVSRSYVNTVNLTNTRVEMTTITNTYNTVVINHSSSAPGITYANRLVNGGVTIVPRETFVNSQPVARNTVTVSAKELANLPVTHIVSVEPAHASVMSATKPSATQPPAAMRNREVVALRTPAVIPQSSDQHQPLAAFSSTQAALVRQQTPGKPVPASFQPLTEEPLTETHSYEALGDSAPSTAGAAVTGTPAKAPYVWEEQGTAEPAKTFEPSHHTNLRVPAIRPAQQSQQQLSTTTRTSSRPASAPAPSRSAPEPEKHSSWYQPNSSSASHVSSTPAKQSTAPPK
jgi:hypothetical protein